MNSIGQELRKQRELRNIELEEIARHTKISIRFLKAIEDDKFNILPEGVYRTKFIASYADYIGIDAEEITNIYKEIYEKPSSGLKKKEFSTESSRRGNYFVYAVIFIVVAAVIVFFLLWIKAEKSTVLENEKSATLSTIPQKALPEKTDAAKKQTKGGINDDDTIAKVVNQGGLYLKVMAINDTWLEVQSDDTIMYKWLLKKGENRIFTANSKILLSKIGNAGGVEFWCNNKKLKSFGNKGEVIKNILITKDTLNNYASDDQ